MPLWKTLSLNTKDDKAMPEQAVDLIDVPIDPLPAVTNAELVLNLSGLSADKNVAAGHNLSLLAHPAFAFLLS